MGTMRPYKLHVLPLGSGWLVALMAPSGKEVMRSKSYALKTNANRAAKDMAERLNAVIAEPEAGYGGKGKGAKKAAPAKKAPARKAPARKQAQVVPLRGRRSA